LRQNVVSAFGRIYICDVIFGNADQSGGTETNDNTAKCKVTQSSVLLSFVRPWVNLWTCNANFVYWGLKRRL